MKEYDNMKILARRTQTTCKRGTTAVQAPTKQHDIANAGGKRTSWMDQEETISDKRKRQLTEAQLDSYKSSYPNRHT